jgi:hypothetical protein
MEKKAKGMKYKLGLFFIILSLVSPVIALLLPFLNLSTEVTATLVAIFFIGLPEVFLLIGAALSGKEAAYALANQARVWLRLNKPPQPVSRFRYHLGLVLFFGGMSLNWIMAYTSPNFIKHLGGQTYLITTFVIDMITISGFFVAGGLFWEKIKNLFVWEEDVPIR